MSGFNPQPMRHIGYTRQVWWLGHGWDDKTVMFWLRVIVLITSYSSILSKFMNKRVGEPWILGHQGSGVAPALLREREGENSQPKPEERKYVWKEAVDTKMVRVESECLKKIINMTKQTVTWHKKDCHM